MAWPKISTPVHVRGSHGLPLPNGIIVFLSVKKFIREEAVLRWIEQRLHIRLFIRNLDQAVGVKSVLICSYLLNLLIINVVSNTAADMFLDI